MLTVIRPGTKATLCDGEIVATVTQVCVLPEGRVRYEVVWWDGRTRKSEWVEPFELRVAAGNGGTVRIGFHGGGD
jgi:hypothetical protein